MPAVDTRPRSSASKTLELGVQAVRAHRPVHTPTWPTAGGAPYRSRQLRRRPAKQLSVRLLPRLLLSMHLGSAASSRGESFPSALEGAVSADRPPLVLSRAPSGAIGAASTMPSRSSSSGARADAAHPFSAVARPPPPDTATPGPGDVEAHVTGLARSRQRSTGDRCRSTAGARRSASLITPPIVTRPSERSASIGCVPSARLRAFGTRPAGAAPDAAHPAAARLPRHRTFR